MKDIAIIIVNYNVKHFLEQCLISVRKAVQHVNAEVIVVDNCSRDGSVDMLEQKFPEIQLIKSPENLGFSAGNNLGIKASNARYVLLLNPDTLVEEDTFAKCLEFMDKTPDAGGLGVKMIDGKGRFLPESKRGLPTPWVAFYKMFGLARLFPKNKRFGRYHLTYLSPEETHEVDVLSGAFMMMRTSVLDKVGWLDETFFMYGEDIDLSYRIQKGGYKNYYFADTSIIHYKGESTKKGSLNYVFIFYKAMIIFARKHFSGTYLGVFTLMIYMAIYARASLSLIARIVKNSLLPAFDFMLIVAAFFLTKISYGAVQDIQYDPMLTSLGIASYGLVLLVALLFNGGYDKPRKVRSILLGFAWGGAFVLLLYGLLPEAYRFSRAILLIGLPVSLGAVLLGRYLLQLFFPNSFRMGNERNRRFAIIGSPKEAKRIVQVLNQTMIAPEFIAFVAPTKELMTTAKDIRYAGHLDQLFEVVDIYSLDEVIFCGADIESKAIIRYMKFLQGKNISYKIAPPESLFVIGSNSINTSGELYSILNISSITKTNNKRNKRTVDVILALVFILLSPILWPLQNTKKGYLSRWFQVLFGDKTAVGYAKEGSNLHELPAIQAGILSPLLNFSFQPGNQQEVAQKLNVLYAKDYHWWSDVWLVLKNLRKL